jgi:peptide methionine sulfoxide reductase MsrA|tara:strand:+ start:598 stop:729 length:132 start_codon:yes stop_codon:yes gene_type:complete
MGGQTDNPSYQDITTGRTGHVEVVQLIFDDAIITTKESLDIFF